MRYSTFHHSHDNWLQYSVYSASVPFYAIPISFSKIDFFNLLVGNRRNIGNRETEVSDETRHVV